METDRSNGHIPPTEIELNDRTIQEFVDRNRWYAPIHLGNDIITRPSAWPDAPPDTPQMGVSRYRFILGDNLPNLQGKRVLDLGCNAGVISLHMARAGAREVVGIDSEKTWPGWLEQAKFVKRVLEWRGATRYNVRYLDADMRDLPKLDLGEFDVVIALCCLYYLSDEDIRVLTRFLAEKTPLFLTQGNTIRNDHHGYHDIKRRAHPAFLRKALSENGFPHVTVDAPWRYGRPVVVGQKERPVSPYKNSVASRLAGLLRKTRYLPWIFEYRMRTRQPENLPVKMSLKDR